MTTRASFVGLLGTFALAACGGAIDPGLGGASGSSSETTTSSPPPSPPSGAVDHPDSGPVPTPDPIDAGPPRAPASFDPKTPVESASGGCVPWTDVASETFVAAPSGSSSDSDAVVIARTLATLRGAWIGHASAPYGWLPAQWDLALEMTPDAPNAPNAPNAGRYAAVTSTFSPSFYYGSDDAQCSDLRSFRLTDVQAYGVGADIDITFHGGSTCYLPAWQGKLTGIAFDASGRRLQFRFATSDGYGPIVYEMWRVCAGH
jgi:hypothetical protein